MLMHKVAFLFQKKKKRGKVHFNRSILSEAMRRLAGLVIGPNEFISMDVIFYSFFFQHSRQRQHISRLDYSRSQRDVSAPRGDCEGYQQG